MRECNERRAVTRVCERKEGRRVVGNDSPESLSPQKNNEKKKEWKGGEGTRKGGGGRTVENESLNDSSSDFDSFE